MLKLKSYNKDKFLAHKPTLVGRVRGISFYEHPLFGDDVQLVAITKGECFLTEYWDLPTKDEINN